LFRFWGRQHLLRAPVPLIGAAALRADVPWQKAAWTPVFLDAVAGEAEDALLLLATLERAWRAARNSLAGRRRHSRAAIAVDICSSYQYLKPGCSVPEADFITHDTDEIIYILEGIGIATYPDKTYQLKPHMTFYNPAGTAHRFWNNSNIDLKMLVLYTRDNVEDVKTEIKTFMD